MEKITGKARGSQLELVQELAAALTYYTGRDQDDPEGRLCLKLEQALRSLKGQNLGEFEEFAKDMAAKHAQPVDLGDHDATHLFDGSWAIKAVHSSACVVLGRNEIEKLARAAGVI